MFLQNTLQENMLWRIYKFGSGNCLPENSNFLFYKTYSYVTIMHDSYLVHLTEVRDMF